MMKYKYIVFSPYFGKLPCNFNLWLNSCAINKKFKFIVFTDDRSIFKTPSNVEIIHIMFNDFKKKIQSKFKFKISLETPYKLCDFKPTYGYIFDEYLSNCIYWGYCDLDLIFGDIEKFLPMYEDYDKISYLGHFCLYKNTKENNELFKCKLENTINYIDILSNNFHFGFDEIGKYGINEIFKFNNKKIFNFEVNVADIDCRYKNMFIIKYKNEKFVRSNKKSLFMFNNNKIIDVNNGNKEYAYIHFQKRLMDNMVTTINKYFICFDKFIDYNESKSRDLFVNNKIDFKFIRFKIKGICRRIKRFIVIKKILKKGSEQS